MKLVNFFENSKIGSGFQEPSESGCLGKQIKKGKSKKKVSETDTVDEHVKGGLDSYYLLTKAKRLAKADGHDYDELPEYHRGKDQPHKEKYKALAKEVSEDIHMEEMDMPDLSDDMIGTPDDYYDAEQRTEAYDDLQTALDGVRNEWEKQSVIDGVCPECSGTSFMDGDYDNDEDSCYGWGNYGCDQGEMENATWVEIIKFDQQNVDRQKAKDNYPGDDEVVNQIANMVKNMDDPRDALFQLQADYPHMGKAQRASLVAQGMKAAGLTKEDVNFEEGTISQTFATDNIDKHDKKIQKSNKKEEKKKIELELLKKLSGIKVDENLKDLERLDLQGYKGLDGKIYKFYPNEGPRQPYPDTDLESPTGKHIGMFRADDGTEALPPIVNPKEPSVFKQGTKIGTDLMKQRIKARDKTAPGNPRAQKQKPGFFGSLFNDIHEDSESDASQVAVSKMIAKALGDENRWTEMSAAELYAELESTDTEMADMVKDVAKMIYGVKLSENKRDTHCSDKCCGADVERKDCECPSDCPHCNCNADYIDNRNMGHPDGVTSDEEDKLHGRVHKIREEEITLEDTQDFHEEFGVLGFSIDENDMFEAEYQGRKVKLNKPMRGDVKKFKVYVKDPKTGNVKKVNFGHGGTSAKRKTMRIRKSNPKARKSFRARHNCSNPGPKTKARYWSCRKW